MRRSIVLTTFALASLAIGLVGCDDASESGTDTSSTSAMDARDADLEVVASTPGEAVYLAPRADGGNFACATCHSLVEPAADGFRRAGHPIGGSTQRGSWKNGAVDSFKGAADSCLVEWMGAAPFASETDEDYVALRDYLDGFGSGAEEPITFTVAAPPADLSGGDATRGAAIYAMTCASCHGAAGERTNIAVQLAGTGLEAAYVARRIRTSGKLDSPIYDGLTGGGMPFWSVERMSDAELRDVVAFVVELSSQPVVEPDMMMADMADMTTGTDTAMPDMTSGCSSTHPKIGQTAVFEEFFHDVGGTATIVDDCTIRIDAFTYDGTGLDVKIYGGIGGNFNEPVGFAIGGQLIRSTPYAGETLTLTLPTDKTMDDLDGLSVWCVDIPVSFGDAMFQ